jgi:hypothetical protein
MLRELLIIAALIVPPAVPEPSASPAPAAPGSLREIGRVRAVTPFCQAVVARATDAVGNALDGNARIGGVIGMLATTDFDANPIVRMRSLAMLTQRYNELRNGILEGERAIYELRERAKTSAIPQEREELLAFTNSLGGALSRQHKLLRDLDGLLSFMESYEPGTNTWAAFGWTGPLSNWTHNAAAEFAQSSSLIAADEGIAADHARPAFARCANALPDADPAAPPQGDP